MLPGSFRELGASWPPFGLRVSSKSELLRIYALSSPVLGHDQEWTTSEIRLEAHCRAGRPQHTVSLSARPEILEQGGNGALQPAETRSNGIF